MTHVTQSQHLFDLTFYLFALNAMSLASVLILLIIKIWDTW